ncbi:MAG: hypothetical protein JRF72_23855, partial [Deltaproteobacteria bacterium]|nr:hypothetical protein [Deltaproteobacteria bacterium]
MNKMGLILIIIILSLTTAYAGPADVLNVETKSAGVNTFQFFVTVRHDDKGWDHYANKWDVVAPDGTVLATR